MDAAMWRLAGPVRGAVARTSLLGLAVVGGYAAQGSSLAFALDAVLRRAPWSVVSAWLGAFAAAMALRAAFIWLAEMAAQDTAQRAKEHLRGRLLRQLVALGPGYAAGQPTGALQAVVVNGVEALEAYYSRYLPAVFVAVSGCLAVLACLAWMDWRSALLLGAFAAAQPLLDHLWLRWRMPRNAGVFAAMGSFAAALLDSLQGIATLKAFGAAPRWRERLAARAAALRRESMSDLYATLMRTGLTGLVMLGGIAAVLAFNVGRVARGELAPAALFLSLFLAREVFRPLERLEKAFHTAWAAAGAVAPMRQLLDAEPPVREARQPRPMPPRFDIAFDDVGFTYPGNTVPALAEVSLTLRECEFVALVGPSGAGKSTLGALLLRLFDPQAGAVRIGGVDARELPLEALRAMVSVVAQDTVLFHGSIGDNLRMANPAATPDEVRAAAASAQIDDFIMRLPQGYATPVGENGAQLSGGQRQRIAIARALLKQSPILLLDEPTSNVDPASDRAIQATLRRLAGRRTLIVIAHRLATIRQADRIVVMDRGRVLEAGRHESLLRQPQGTYARLLSAQTALENPLEALT